MFTSISVPLDGSAFGDAALPYAVSLAPTLEAIRLMRERGLSALPVVRNGQVVGIISERDSLPIAAHVLATDSG